MKQNNSEIIKQIKIFEEILALSQRYEYELQSFVITFLKSEIFEEILNYSDVVFYNPYTVFSSFVREHDIRKKSKNYYEDTVIKYIAFIYIKYYYQTNDSFSSILEQLPIDKLLKNYDSYHTLSERYVIFNCQFEYNLKMNPMRKIRTKTSFNLLDLKKDKLLFATKVVVQKLFRDYENETIRWKYKDGIEYLSNDKKMIACFIVENEKQITEAFVNPILSHLLWNFKNNTIILYLQNPSNIQSIINSLRNNEANKLIKHLFFYTDKMFWFIGQGYDLTPLYMPISQLDIKRIENEFINRYKTEI